MEAGKHVDAQITVFTCVQGRKTYRTFQQLVPAEMSLRIADNDYEISLVEIMFGELWGLIPCIDSQTPNGDEK